MPLACKARAWNIIDSAPRPRSEYNRAYRAERGITRRVIYVADEFQGDREKKGRVGNVSADICEHRSTVDGAGNSQKNEVGGGGL